MVDDPRRRIPRTDHLLELVRSVQQRARTGLIAPEEVESVLLAAAASAFQGVGLRPVLNATGVVVHTNLGRAPLSRAAVAAVIAASGYTDVEIDLDTGKRTRRGGEALAALRRACPAAEDVLVVNNGAAALVLATTALCMGREVVVSRGELVEIGAGFRLSDLIASTGALLREVGATNRTHLRDYVDAIGPDTGCILKVHPSNFRVEGFTSGVSITELRSAVGDLPIIADLGSGLLRPEPRLPDEPDVSSALASGADLVVASGDKLLGGPQAGLLLGRADLIKTLANHPLSRAVRVDKLTIAALEATLSNPSVPVRQALDADVNQLRQRTVRLGAQLDLPVVPHDGRVGGGGAPGVALPGWAVRLPESAAPWLRSGDPAVLPRVRAGHCLIDLRCIPESDDQKLLDAIQRCLVRL
ncbi:L-seryl-tRNA(Sec) selenium transferase [Pimelobacter simplex]|uniref:L-seryl-tRNA(Sec) selenium transferase n=1 Tax=Nocardioides simplex TaxID=2045 RepID=UPI001934A3F3|nr:L-seryl-tRNA(Sec) selenium transferase [Pimelobacter simplex]